MVVAIVPENHQRMQLRERQVVVFGKSYIIHSSGLLSVCRMSNSVTPTVVQSEPKGCKGTRFVREKADSKDTSLGSTSWSHTEAMLRKKFADAFLPMYVVCPFSGSISRLSASCAATESRKIIRWSGGSGVTVAGAGPPRSSTPSTTSLMADSA